ncbi:TetR/AcrR family transcriptional regulator [Terrimonas rubra]|uniref:TetR/AcrR family transcriptional regulator n=1 Tax=Terrimonas rubra TaxID=1035890 RepID=A0ABW6A6H2_9BACT
MSAKDKGTEELIKETAKRIFFAEGKFHATTQEIADAAGVNRTLLHYYFRSRDILLEKVIIEGQQEFKLKLSEKIDPNISFKEKVGEIIDIWMEHAKKYPYLDAYLASQIHNSEMVDNIHAKGRPDSKLVESFFAEMQVEMDKGTIPQMDPYQFLLNIISLVSYPLTMRPLLEKGLAVSKKSYSKLIAERKEAILKTLFRK